MAMMAMASDSTNLPQCTSN